MRSEVPRAFAAALVLATACGPALEACRDEPGIACRYIGTGELGLNGDRHPARDTKLYWVMDVAFAPDGTPYVLDWNNHTVRRIGSDGTVETVIGDTITGGPTEESAPGTEVSLNHPTDMAFLADGTMLLCAWHNHMLLTWDPTTGILYSTAGDNVPGYAGDGETLSRETRFNQPRSLALAPDGTVYVLDQRNFRIRRVTPGGVLSTIAGDGTAGSSGDGGPAPEAQLRFEAGGNPEPSGGLTLHGSVLYVADGLNHRIRALDLSTGTIDTVAGAGEAGFSGDGGSAAAARFDHPRDVEIGPDGRLYFADTENDRIRAIDLGTGVIETIAGSGERGMGPEGRRATETALHRPMGIAFGPDDALYVSDTYNSRVLRIPL
jgi:DNA-binding beta-propeller fold protein YncE